MSRVNVSHMIPRSKADLKRRHEGLARIAETSMGLMGRTPDYMNVTFAGFAGERSWWEGPERTNVEGHANLVAFQRQLALEDISLTHTIVHPTIDRATDANLVDNPVPLHKTGDTEHGIVVRGAASWPRWRRSPTRSPSIRPPAGAGYPARCALSFSIPIDTPGLVFLSRPGVDPRRQALRSSAVVALRRTGRVRDLRRRRGAASGCSSTPISMSTTR